MDYNMLANQSINSTNAPAYNYSGLAAAVGRVLQRASSVGI